MKKILSLLLCAALLLCLTACGGSSKSEIMYSTGGMMEEAAPMEAPMAADNAASLKGSQSGSTALPEGRKWIITMDMNVETDDLDVLMPDLDQKISGLGGYVEDQNIHNGSNYASHRYRSASLTVRIPAEMVDKFAENVEGMANVVRSTKNLEDITLTYVSTESRVKALQTEEARLLELMEQAETMYDLLEIEGRLTEVRYQLENYTSRLKVYDNQVDFATIYLTLEEVQEYTPVAERTVWQRITEGFGDSLEGVWEGAVDLFVWIIVSLPYLVVWGVGLTVAVILVKRIRRRKPVKSFKRKAKMPLPETEPETEE